MKTILYANTISYFSPLQQRPHHIMNLLAKRGYKIHWVETKQSLKRRENYGNITVWHDWEIFKKRIKEVDIYFSTWANRYVDLDQINYKYCIYDSVDNFKQHENNEIKMINKADYVLVTSELLYKIRKHQHKNVVNCKNGCFSDLGNKVYNKPRDVEQFKDGYLLFSGALGTWVDISVLEYIARKYPVVFVGSPYGARIPKNVFYLGSKKYDELQAYYSYCDLNLLPFKRCQTSDYSNPIKMYEGMSHGKITVSTDIPDALLYKDVVLCSNNKEHFLQNVKKGLSIKNNPEVIIKCKNNAKENDWNIRVEKIEKIIRELGE